MRRLTDIARRSGGTPRTWLVLATAGLLTAAWVAPAAGFGSRDGGSSAAGDVPPAAVRDLIVTPSAISPNGDGRDDALTASFQLDPGQTVTAEVDDADGHEVRTLATPDGASGPATIVWDGRSASGAAVPDGDYQLTITAQTGSDSSSVSGIVTVDTAAPTVSVPGGALTVPAAGASGALRMQLSEAAMVQVGGSSTASAAVAQQSAGRSTLQLGASTVSALRTAARRARGHRLRVRIEALDAAGNEGTAVIPVTIGAPRPATDTPAAPTDTAPSGGSGDAGSTAGIVWPAFGPITSPFGPRWGGFHYGLDIGAGYGKPVRAVLAGTVTWASAMGGYGNLIQIVHGKGLSTRYGHESRVIVHVGQHVAKDQLIGYIGATGDATGPHLHFEIRFANVPKDPAKYLP